MDKFSFDNEIKENIKLRVHREIWDQIAAYFGDNNVVPDDDEHYLITARLIIGYCNYCVCLEPESMRSLIKDLLAKTGTSPMTAMDSSDTGTENGAILH